MKTKVLFATVAFLTTFSLCQAFNIASLSALVEPGSTLGSDDNISSTSGSENPLCELDNTLEIAGCGCLLFHNMRILPPSSRKLCRKIFLQRPKLLREKCLRRYFKRSTMTFAPVRLSNQIYALLVKCPPPKILLTSAPASLAKDLLEACQRGPPPQSVLVATVVAHCKVLVRLFVAQSTIPDSA